MNKSMLSLLAIGFLAMLAALPVAGHAASLRGPGYMKISVPDMQQAVTFFRDVLDCEWIAPPDTGERTQNATSSSRLLICDSGSVVELFPQRQTDAPPDAAKDHRAPIRFFANDVTTADRWLQREGVTVVGTPVTVTTGPHAGQTLVNFVSPWGLRMQLVSWGEPVATAGP